MKKIPFLKTNHLTPNPPTTPASHMLQPSQTISSTRLFIPPRHPSGLTGGNWFLARRKKLAKLLLVIVVLPISLYATWPRGVSAALVFSVLLWALVPIPIVVKLLLINHFWLNPDDLFDFANLCISLIDDVEAALVDTERVFRRHCTCSFFGAIRLLDVLTFWSAGNISRSAAVSQISLILRDCEVSLIILSFISFIVGSTMYGIFIWLKTDDSGRRSDTTLVGLLVWATLLSLLLLLPALAIVGMIPLPENVIILLPTIFFIITPPICICHFLACTWYIARRYGWTFVACCVAVLLLFFLLALLAILLFVASTAAIHPVATATLILITVFLIFVLLSLVCFSLFK